MPPAPRLLLLEDDPVSACFLREALAALPVRVTVADTLARAFATAARDDALWLMDAHLPDGHAATLLPRLRALGFATPALALTADAGDEACRTLRDAGFAQVLEKPVAADALRAAVRGWRSGPVLPAWDDGAASRVLGGAAAVPALRALFLAELPEQRRRVVAACAAGDRAEADALLHRLKASCGFVGASALADAVRAVAAAPDDAAAVARFDACARALADGISRAAVPSGRPSGSTT